MADTTFSSGTVVTAEWCNDVNNFVYKNVINVKTSPYNAVGDGITDDTAAIQAAITAVGEAGGGQVFLPAGTYKLSAQLSVPYDGVSIVGVNRTASLLQQTTASAPIISVDKKYFTAKDLGFSYTSTPTEGAYGILIGGVNSGFAILENLWIWQANIGIALITTNGINMQNIDMRDTETNCIYIEDTIDVRLNGFAFDCGNQTRNSLGAIRLIDLVEALTISDGDIINGAYSLTTDASSYTIRTRPAGNKFTSVWFDTSDGGCFLKNCVDMDFVECWFSNCNEHNIRLDVCDGIRFTGGQTLSSRKHGAYVTSDAKRVSFVNFSAKENSVGSSGTYHGIYIAPDTTDFRVQSCTVAGPALYSATLYQGYGVFVDTGASDRYIIADNFVTGNFTGGVSDSGSGSNKRVENNY